jgi:hypothetical protein
MDYAFPDDLARQIVRRWPSFSGRRNTAPPLPSPAHLRHILATAFFAGLMREEGRPVRFVLCCSPDLDVLRDGFGETVPVVPLATPRPVTVEAIRSLAPAVSPNNAAILVTVSARRSCRLRNRRSPARRRARGGGRERPVVLLPARAVCADD